ncbi:MAG TPA: pyridoxal-phosphate dependent enzyme [Polyangiaceae bacterium]|jgi:D-cysteine desulfhydrase|nr:pyridoxal-phosphate dependent enzyme [Polyangiaceae bacterium]
MLSFGRYPTPVRLLAELSLPSTALWIKHDDLASPVYGGNKVRKLDRLLEDALARRAERVVTIGALGSHHVLATGIFGKSLGLDVAAVVLRQKATAHVLDNVRADLAQGIELIPATSYAQAAVLLAARVASGAYYIPVGGSNRVGTLGFVLAASELAEQVRRGELPEPDLIVVPLGSGGTVAGLLAGLAQEKLRTRVLGVTVVEPAAVLERAARALAKQCVTRELRRSVLERLEITRSYLGRGYGYASPEGERATAQAATVGVTLDATYTSKAFAAALDRVARGRERNILYWHTLSSAPMEPLLVGAPEESALSAKLRALAVP